MELQATQICVLRDAIEIIEEEGVDIPRSKLFFLCEIIDAALLSEITKDLRQEYVKSPDLRKGIYKDKLTFIHWSQWKSVFEAKIKAIKVQLDVVTNSSPSLFIGDPNRQQSKQDKSKLN